MSKIRAIKAEFEKHEEAVHESAKKAMEMSLQEMENVVITEDQQEILDNLKEKTGIEINGLDMSQIIDELAESFDVRKMAEPALEVFRGAEQQGVHLFIAAFDLDEEEYPEEYVLEILREAYVFYSEQYNVDKEHGFTDAVVNRILSKPVALSQLPQRYREILFGNVQMVNLDKYRNKTSEALMALAHIAMKESIDDFIEKQSIEMELFGLQEKKIIEIRERYKDKEVATEILKQVVEGIKDSNPNIQIIDKNSSIEIKYRKNIVSLRTMASLCRDAEYEVEGLRERMELQAKLYEEKADILERVLNLNFMTPLEVYYDSLVTNNPKKKRSMEEDLLKQLELFIMRVAKYRFHVPMPGYKDTDKTFGDIKRSMSEYYFDALTNYYNNREELKETNPDIDLPIYTGSFLNGTAREDLGAGSFTIFVLLMLSRFDKKHMKHVDFEEDKMKMLEYYLVYEIMSLLSTDTFTFARIIEKANRYL